MMRMNDESEKRKRKEEKKIRTGTGLIRPKSSGHASLF